MASPILLWFRNDLRLTDHPALTAALTTGQPVIPVYIDSSDDLGPSAPGAASRWWLHQSLAALARSIERLGGRLLFRTGPTAETLRQLARETGAQAVLCTRDDTPDGRQLTARVTDALFQYGVPLQTHGGYLLFEPEAIENKSGKPFQVFTPFWKHCLKVGLLPEAPLPAPAAPWPTPAAWPESVSLGDFHLEPTLNWADGFRDHWTPGEAGALARLEAFLADGVIGYAERRERPDWDGSSRLSPHLHFGELSPRWAWHRTQAALSTHPEAARGAEHFLREIGWREFGAHLLVHFPHTVTQPLRPEFADFPWADDPAGLRAWQRGRTGYPMVDAGMRQLWHTGWMHNRLRMVVGSFLVKDLLLPWQAGAAWFWDTLLDADLGSNTLGWQWIGGCGADAAPYFRVYNPVTQGEKHDPNGDYVRRWVPELAGLPTEYLHQPWTAPPLVLRAAGVTLGDTYPRPIVDHTQARERALAALRQLRGEMPAEIR